MDCALLPGRATEDLMVLHVVLAGGRTFIHHQIVVLFGPVALCPVLRIAVLHYQDAPSTCWCGMVGEER